MNKFFFLSLMFFSLFFYSCTQNKKNVKIDFELENYQSTDSIFILGEGISKTINLTDTIHLKKAGYFTCVVNKNPFQLYLKNGFNLKIHSNMNDFYNQLTFSGKGKNENSFLNNWLKKIIDFSETTNLYKLDSAKFFKELLHLEKYLFKELNSTKKDTGFSHFESQQLTNYFLNSKKTYIENYINSLRFQSGNAAPKFKDFENITGGKNSLIDFKGNYILLNIWATWCKPCIDDIVLLNQLSNHYQILKIINISIDNFKDKSLWNKIVDDKKFKGIHLFAGSDNNYLKSLNVVSVPRFVLIDPNGKMITDNIVRNFQNFKTYLDPMLK